MTPRRDILVALTLSVTLSLAAVPVAGMAGSAAPGSELSLWLKGPFGTVLGGSAEAPAATPPEGNPLDAWMRGATLEIAADVPFDELVELRVTSRPATDDAPGRSLAEGEWWFRGPDIPGLYVISASAEAAGRLATERAWLVEVPDRPGAWETFLQMPMVGAELRAAAGTVAGERGHACHVGLCQEVGLRPPPDTLPALSVAIGETPSLHLSDGSALVHWQGRLEPLAGTIAETRLAQDTFEHEPRAAPELVGLEPTAAGEWLLEVRADYDRERGWGWYLFRLIAE